MVSYQGLDSRTVFYIIFGEQYKSRYNVGSRFQKVRLFYKNTAVGAVLHHLQHLKLRSLYPKKMQKVHKQHCSAKPCLQSF